MDHGCVVYNILAVHMLVSLDVQSVCNAARILILLCHVYQIFLVKLEISVLEMASSCF